MIEQKEEGMIPGDQKLIFLEQSSQACTYYCPDRDIITIKSKLVKVVSP